MSELYYLTSLHLTNCILCGWYILHFLRPRYHRRRTILLWGSIYFLMQYAVYRIPDGWYPFGEAASTALHIAILFLLLILFFEHDKQKRIFVVFSLAAGMGIVRHMAGITVFLLGGFQSNLLMSYMQRSDWSVQGLCFRERIYDITFAVLWLLSYALPFGAYLFLLSRQFVRKEYRLKAQENVFLVLPCIAALAITVAFKILLMTVEDGAKYLIYDKVPSVKFWVPVICLLLLFTIIACVTLFQKLVEYHEEAAKRAMLENQVQQMQKEIRELQEVYADIRGMRHDMKNHLANIAALVKTAPEDKTQKGEQYKELDHYIRKMEETVDRLDPAFQTGNPITDIILHQKQQEAEKQGIGFAADFTYPQKLQIDVYDIAVILNNALENAMEACGSAEDEGQIRLFSYTKGSLFFIEIENNFTGEIITEETGDLPKSTKKDGEEHGIGLSNIQRCARKYKGELDIAIEETRGRKVFRLTVMMNGKVCRA